MFLLLTVDNTVPVRRHSGYAVPMRRRRNVADA
jgi:hypothetical protein